MKVMFPSFELDSAAFAPLLVSTAYLGKDTTAFERDGVGDRNPLQQDLLIVTTDDVPDSTSTTATLEVDGDHVISTIDTIGDQDYYAVTLTAGVAYEIGMYGYAGGPNLAPLADAYVEILDADGNLITSGDGGADTPLNLANSGFDVLMTFTPETTGTYYVNARAFDNIPDDGTDGDLVGDYEVFVQTAPPDAYHPYYGVDSPLYAIDWGTQVDGTARNPDGNEGTRATGNAQGTPEPPYAPPVEGKNIITIYFAQAGDVFVSNDPLNPGLPPATITATGVQDFEHEAVWTALHEFEKVADVTYVEVTDRSQANFIYTSYIGTPGPGVSLLGSMSPPGESDQGLAQFNSGDYRWNATDLQQGGFSFVTLIHEFGHGHGLAHPHDNGGHSGIMNGVESEGAVADYTLGDYDLNQGVFTMMSYEDGWQSSPYGNAPTDVGYGYLGGLMAFDIAAIQDKYGVNEDYHTGNNTYVMPEVNQAGTFYYCIWDAAGSDKIVYNGTVDANIDLRPATLEYETGGGGNVCYADGIFGGFTIANGVTIEDAVGGSGNDTLTGNDADNRLYGRAGDDQLNGGDGDDNLAGKSGYDIGYGEAGNDTLIVEEAYGGHGNDTILDAVLAFGGLGNDSLVGAANGRAELHGDEGDDVLKAGAKVDTLDGGDGNDKLNGGAGRDFLTGGTGADNFRFNDGEFGGNTADKADAISDFSHLDGDRIVLASVDAVVGGADNAFQFVGDAAFSNTAGELRYEQIGGNTYVMGDTDGMNGADFMIRLDGLHTLSAGDFVL